MLVNASVVAGIELENAMLRMFRTAQIEYLYLHNAKPGCYAARVDRA